MGLELLLYECLWWTKCKTIFLQYASVHSSLYQSQFLIRHDYISNGFSVRAIRLALIVCLLFSECFHVVWDLYSTLPLKLWFLLLINLHDLVLLLFHINRYPYVTGTSVIALKYKDGVIMACDTGG